MYSYYKKKKNYPGRDNTDYSVSPMVPAEKLEFSKDVFGPIKFLAELSSDRVITSHQGLDGVVIWDFENKNYQFLKIEGLLEVHAATKNKNILLISKEEFEIRTRTPKISQYFIKLDENQTLIKFNHAYFPSVSISNKYILWVIHNSKNYRAEGQDCSFIYQSELNILHIENMIVDKLNLYGSISIGNFADDDLIWLVQKGYSSAYEARRLPSASPGGLYNLETKSIIGSRYDKNGFVFLSKNYFYFPNQPEVFDFQGNHAHQSVLSSRPHLLSNGKIITIENNYCFNIWEFPAYGTANKFKPKHNAHYPLILKELDPISFVPMPSKKAKSKIPSFSVSPKSLWNSVLHDLVRKGKTKALAEKLAKEGCLLEQLDGAGDTLLLIAARLGLVDIVELLLRHGARLECKAKNGDTVLAVATAQGHQAVVDYLNKHQTVFARDVNDETALHKAVSAGQLPEVENLLKLGAYVNAQNKSDETPLHKAAQAAWRGAVSKDIAECLMTAGADVTLVDEQGRTALLTLSNPNFYQPLTTLLIQARNRLPQIRLNRTLAVARLRHVGDFEHCEADRKLLDQAFQSLTGDIEGNSISQLMDACLLKYLGHLISLKGHYERVSHNQVKPPKKPNDPRGISFEGFLEQFFLALRGRVLFETIILIEKGLLTDYPVGQKETVLRAMKQELSVLLEALRSFLERRFVRDKLSDAPWALDALARNLCQHIMALQPGEQYQYCAGYDQHAVYASFEKRPEKPGQIVYRLDNLGQGCNVHATKKTPYKRKAGQGEKCLPYAFSLPESNFSPGAAKPAKIVLNLFECNYASYPQALTLIYDVAGKTLIPQAELEQWYPWRRVQSVGNCVVKNHQVGLHIRLRAFSPGGTEEQRNAFYRWWRQKEPSLLPIKSYLVQASIAVGYGTLKGSKSDVEDPQAFYLDPEIAQEVVQAAKEQGYTDLHLAIVANNVSKVKFLVEQGEDLSETTKEGYHAIHLALVYQATESLDYLLKHAKQTQTLDDLLNTTTRHGDTLLHLLARQPEAQIQETLPILEAHHALSVFNPNAVNDKGETAQDYVIELDLGEIIDNPSAVSQDKINAAALEALEKKEQELTGQIDRLTFELQQEQEQRRKFEALMLENLQYASSSHHSNKERDLLEQIESLTEELQQERKQRQLFEESLPERLGYLTNSRGFSQADNEMMQLFRSMSAQISQLSEQVMGLQSQVGSLQQQTTEQAKLIETLKTKPQLVTHSNPQNITPKVASGPRIFEHRPLPHRPGIQPQETRPSQSEPSENTNILMMRNDNVTKPVISSNEQPRQDIAEITQGVSVSNRRSMFEKK